MSVVWTAVSVQGDVIWDFASGAVLLISVLFLPRGFPGGSDGKEPACNARDPGLIPGSGRFPGEGSDYPIQYSCLENPIVGDSSWNLKELVMTKRIALSFSFLPVEFPRVMLWPSHKLWESHNRFCFFFFFFGDCSLSTHLLHALWRVSHGKELRLLANSCMSDEWAWKWTQQVQSSIQTTVVVADILISTSWETLPESHN